MNKFINEDAPFLNIKIPTSVANVKLPDPELLNYYKDNERRIYYLQGEIDTPDTDLIKYIMRCNAEDVAIPADQRLPIIIVIDSPGGNAEVLQAIVGAIKISKTPIATVNMCVAYSAAAILLASGHKGLRFSLPNTNTMFHSGYASISGTATQVDDAKKYYDGMDKRIMDNLFSVTNFPKTVQTKIKRSNDVYMTENECLEYGVIDKILDSFDDLFKIGCVEVG